MKKMKKKIGLVAAALLAVTAVIYIGFAIFFHSHFLFRTTIDNIAVGGKSVTQVKKLITAEIDGYSLKLLERGDETEVISGSSIGIAPVFASEVEELLEEQNGFAWVAGLFRKTQLELEKTVAYDEEKLDEVLSGLSCMQSGNQRKPVNASYSDYSKKDGYTLVPADYGTTIDKAAFQAAVAEAVTDLTDELDLSESGCYVQPDVGDDDKKLLAVIDKLNHYAGTTITYEFGDEREVLDGSTINEWLSASDGKVTVDEEAVSEYVKTLAKSHNTAYRPKTLETSYGTTVTITAGFYGWKIDNAEEKAQILADLEAGKAVEREPVYSQTANSHSGNDYGDSYVEINLTAQHLFLYQEGKLVVESDFVSGNLSKGHATPVGAFGLTYKTTNAVLRGEDYATPVDYWMPYAGDVGMHDATWRKSFGGSIYKTNGSHGCVNLPHSVAKTIYEAIEKGYAVLVYELPGTESKAVQQQDAANVVNLINSIGVVTLESETAITTARNLYNALPDSAKAYVTNYDVLVAAEAALAPLKAAQADAAAQQAAAAAAAQAQAEADAAAAAQAQAEAQAAAAAQAQAEADAAAQAAHQPMP